jgi:hypothetical protein
MKIKIIASLISFFTFSSLFAQIRTLDAETDEPIPFVEMYSEEGVYLGNSDEQGIISSLLLDKLKGNASIKQIRLQQMTYDKVSMDLETFLSSSTVYLKRKVIDLDELIVKPTNKKYGIILEGYYRGYQFSGQDLEFYSEGKVQLYYKNDFSDGKNKRIEERHYYNDKIKQIDNFTMRMVGPNVPNFYEITKGNKVTKKAYSQEKNIIAIENLKYDMLNPKNIKLLGNESNIYFYNDSYIFNSRDDSQTLGSDLVYYKTARNLKFKCKECKDFIDYSSVNEFFVTDVKIVNDKPKGFKVYTGAAENSRFQTEFWKEAEKNPFFEPLDARIRKKISEDLTLYPSK